MRNHKIIFLQILFLALSISAVYGFFLWNPVVFDDIYFFNGSVHEQYLGNLFSLDLRWLPYATFEWTRVFFGFDLIWFHLGNMAIHIANATLLFVLIRELLWVTDISNSKTYQSWIAVLSALIFALHPVSVYAVSYLSQRSILMATFFVLVMLNLAVQGLLRRSYCALLASALAYLFAVLSKEHAVMAPTLALALILLLQKPAQRFTWRILSVFVLYTLIAVFVVYQVKTQNVLGQAYEINGNGMLARLASSHLNFDVSLAYPLSILTQCFLFFKYLAIWIVPSPAWMSIDMIEDFSITLTEWPYVLSAFAFVLYFSVAVYLLLKRERKGLFGFAMLCPWLLFATEFSTVRIQESFVLYRSYLWMFGFTMMIPLLLRHLSSRRALLVLGMVIVLLVPLTWSRLTTFSHPLLLWDDAAQLIEKNDKRPGVERIFHNRGIEFARLKMYRDALKDYDRALVIYPQYSYVYNDRGAVYLEIGDYQRAIVDFKKSIELNPNYPKSYMGLVRAYASVGNHAAAQKNYLKLCAMGTPVVKCNSDSLPAPN